jgi:predicted peroxiredoxin
VADQQKLVIVITCGLADERTSVAWSMANGALACELDLSIFLASSGVDHVRKGAYEHIHLNPMDPPMKDMVQRVLDAGCTIFVCPPCMKVRGYTEDDYIDGVTFAGSPALHALIKEGAQTLSF